MERREILDLHTHTVASGHAYCTLREMAKAASEKGLKVLGITEHAPKMPGTCHNYYFHNLKVVPRQMYGITLLLGAELNILDFDGNVDLSQRAGKSGCGNCQHSWSLYCQRNQRRLYQSLFKSHGKSLCEHNRTPG